MPIHFGLPEIPVLEKYRAVLIESRVRGTDASVLGIRNTSRERGVYALMHIEDKSTEPVLEIPIFPANNASIYLELYRTTQPDIFTTAHLHELLAHLNMGNLDIASITASGRSSLAALSEILGISLTHISEASQGLNFYATSVLSPFKFGRVDNEYKTMYIAVCGADLVRKLQQGEREQKEVVFMSGLLTDRQLQTIPIPYRSLIADIQQLFSN